MILIIHILSDRKKINSPFMCYTYLVTPIYIYVCIIQIICITHNTIMMRKPWYMNTFLNEELTRNTRLQYSNMFAVPSIYQTRSGRSSFMLCSSTLQIYLPKTLRCIRNNHVFKHTIRPIIVPL